MTQPNNRITTKELFERVIQLETKIDMFLQRTQRTERRFTGYVVAMCFLTLLNTVISVVFFYKYVL